MRFAFLLLYFFMHFSVFAQKADMNSKLGQLIKKQMDFQVNCWNKGDLEGFMSIYWKSEQLVFIGKNGPSYGWQKVLDNYKKSYDGKEKMGTLQFDLLDFRQNGPKSAWLIGKWTINRPNGEILSGHFLLVWEKIEGDWKIVADHSS